LQSPPSPASRPPPGAIACTTCGPTAERGLQTGEVPTVNSEPSARTAATTPVIATGAGGGCTVELDWETAAGAAKDGGCACRSSV
jgi:hypothetical protein